MGKFRWIPVVLLLLAVPVSASAAELAPDTSALTEGLSPEQRELMGEMEPLSSPEFPQAVTELISRAAGQSGGALREAVRTSAVLLGICFLSALGGTGERGSLHPARMAGVLGVAAVCTDGLTGLLRLGSDTVRELAAFSQLLFPVLASASAAAGAVTTAPAVYGLTVLCSDLLLSLLTGVLLPAVSVYLLLSAADCVLEHASLRRLCSLLIWGIKTMLKTILYVFTGFLTVTQVVSGTADAMTTKAAKLTISGMVPVVGSILSDASETVLVSAALIRNSLGVFGLLGVLAVCILPFLRLGIWYLTLRLTAAVSGIAAPDGPVRMVEAASEGLGLLLAMTGTTALLLLISVVCTIKTVGI